MLNGKPLIAYTIEAALGAKTIDRVIVNTDSEEIASIAKEFGAEVPFMRPGELATDNANSIDVYRHALKTIEHQEQVEIKAFVVLQPTSPLRTSKHIDEAVELFNNKKADSVISYCEESHPIFWHKHISDDGQFENVFTGDYLKNRQDIRKTYFPNGAIYIFAKDLKNQNKYYTENSYAYIMDRTGSVDIDTIEDFEYVEYLFCKYKKQ